MVVIGTMVQQNAAHSVHVVLWSLFAGSMTVESLGRLNYLSDCRSTLYPVDYW